MFVVQKSTMEK